MRIAKGPRPPSIKAFAAILLALATWNLVAALFDLEAQQVLLESLGLDVSLDRDSTIITSSAWFTIELIPIAWVWLFASPFARWFIVVMAIMKVALAFANFGLLMALPGMMLGWSISLGAVALLFTPGANAWFAKEEPPGAREFD